MNLVSFVFQDSFLFYDTIYENIAVGQPDATQQDVEHAARAAQCHDFIMSLPNGYHTRIGDHGVYLSGGEAQRICVARAILKNAPILVLDEATAFAQNQLSGAQISAKIEAGNRLENHHRPCRSYAHGGLRCLSVAERRTERADFRDVPHRWLPGVRPAHLCSHQLHRIPLLLHCWRPHPLTDEGTRTIRLPTGTRERRHHF